MIGFRFYHENMIALSSNQVCNPQRCGKDACPHVVASTAGGPFPRSVLHIPATCSPPSCVLLLVLPFILHVHYTRQRLRHNPLRPRTSSHAHLLRRPEARREAHPRARRLAYLRLSLPGRGRSIDVWRGRSERGQCGETYSLGLAGLTISRGDGERVKTSKWVAPADHVQQSVHRLSGSSYEVADLDELNSPPDLPPMTVFPPIGFTSGEETFLWFEHADGMMASLSAQSSATNS
jgi:hypothetical protein